MSKTPRSRELLSQYRAENAPSAGAKERVLSAVAERILLGAPPPFDVDPGAFHAPPAEASLLAKLGASTAAKVVATAVAVTAPAAVWYAASPATEARAPTPSAATSSATAAAATGSAAANGAGPQGTERALAGAPSLIRLSDLPAVSASGESGAPDARVGRAVPAGSTRTEPAATVVELAERPSTTGPTEDTLREDVNLLTRANEALAAGDAVRALALVTEHRARFPTSRLADAREVTRAVALCRAGRATEGGAMARAFLARSPRSPFAERLRAACGVK